MEKSCLNDVVDRASQVYMACSCWHFLYRVHQGIENIQNWFIMHFKIHVSRKRLKKTYWWTNFYSLRGVQLACQEVPVVKKNNKLSNLITLVNNKYMCMLLRPVMTGFHVLNAPLTKSNHFKIPACCCCSIMQNVTDWLFFVWTPGFKSSFSSYANLDIYPALSSPVLGTTSLPPAWPNTAVALWAGLLGGKEACGANRVLPLLLSVVPTAL